MTRTITQTRELSAQCSLCKDVFSVVLSCRFGEFELEGTQAAKLAEVVDHGGRTHVLLKHRCGGVARVIWPELSGELFRERRAADPLRLN